MCSDTGEGVGVRTRKQTAERKQARRAGTKRQPSPEGLGHRSQGRPSAGGAALADEWSAAPPALHSLWICLPTLPGWADVWSRPYGPVSALGFVFVLSHSLIQPQVPSS